MFYVGIDWADQKHDTLVLDEAGQQVGSLRVDHSPERLRQLDAFLERISGPGRREQMACSIETTHGLLIAHLLEAGWPVYPVNPRTVDRKSGSSGANPTALMRICLLKQVELTELRRLTPDSEIVQERKALTRDQDALIQMQTRRVNQLTACLKAYYPVALQLFTKLHQRSTLIFLQSYPTPQQAMAASVEAPFF
jgi:transposase